MIEVSYRLDKRSFLTNKAKNLSMISWLLLIHVCLAPLTYALGNPWIQSDARGNPVYDMPVVILDMPCDGNWTWKDFIHHAGGKFERLWEFDEQAKNRLKGFYRPFLLKDESIHVHYLVKLTLDGKEDILIDCNRYSFGFSPIVYAVVMEKDSVQLVNLGALEKEPLPYERVNRQDTYPDFDHFLNQLERLIDRDPVRVRFSFLLDQPCQLADYWDVMKTFFHRHYGRTSLRSLEPEPAKKKIRVPLPARYPAMPSVPIRL